MTSFLTILFGGEAIVFAACFVAIGLILFFEGRQ
jgi:hypothetical protein